MGAAHGNLALVRHGSESAGSAGSAFASPHSASHMFEGAAKESAELFPAVSFLPKLLPLAGGLRRSVQGFVLRDSQTSNSAAPRWGKERVRCSLWLRTRMCL